MQLELNFNGFTRASVRGLLVIQMAVACQKALACVEHLGANDRIRRNDFTIGRTFRSAEAENPVQSYEFLLGPDFISFVGSIPPGESWLDAGAGSALALRSVLKAKPGVRGTAISLQRPVDQLLENDLIALPNFIYLTGSLTDLLASTVGSHLAISDVIGPATYSPDLYGVLNKYLEYCKRGTRVGLNFNLGYYEERGSKRDYVEHLTIKKASGEPVPLQDYFARSLGLSVVTATDLEVPGYRVSDRAPIPRRAFRVVLDVTAPNPRFASLELENFEDVPNRAPKRSYLLK